MKIMNALEIFAIIVFIILLIASIYMLLNFYVCDNQNCKAFTTAGNQAPEGSCKYVTKLLGELGNDGIWPLPYIGAAILTPLSLWFMGITITVINFAILFFVSFVVTYFLFSFYNHHYVKQITNYTSNFIQSNCNSNTSNFIQSNCNSNTANVETSSLEVPPLSTSFQAIDNNSPFCEPSDNTNAIHPIFKSFDDGLNITFATPVNIF